MLLLIFKVTFQVVFKQVKIEFVEVVEILNLAFVKHGKIIHSLLSCKRTRVDM